MYETLLENIKGHIDAKSIVDNTVIVKGWCYSNNMPCTVRCKYNNTFTSTEPEIREDISKFFKTDVKSYGWVGKIPLNVYVDAQIKINDEWLTYLSFNTFNIVAEHNQTTLEISSNNILEPPQERPKINLLLNFGMNRPNTNLYIIDNFYSDPTSILNYGNHCIKNNISENLVEKVSFYKLYFEEFLHGKISSLNKYTINGKFTNTLEYSNDTYQYLAIICLNRDTSLKSNISLYTKHNNKVEDNYSYESLEKSDIINCMYNRLIIINTKNIPLITLNSGQNESDLFQLFAFDLD